jgi:hypothetical protein
LATKKKGAPAKKKSEPAKKKAAAGRPASAESKRAAKPAKGSSTSKRRPRASASSERRNVVPWAERFKDAPGPWTCPKCGPLPLRAQPLYGEDEKHHCPNVECDAVVTLLSKEDLEPAERRGSWPPQRNKQRALGEGGLGGPPPPLGGEVEAAD